MALRFRTTRGAGRGLRERRGEAVEVSQISYTVNKGSESSGYSQRSSRQPSYFIPRRSLSLTALANTAGLIANRSVCLLQAADGKGIGIGVSLRTYSLSCPRVHPLGARTGPPPSSANVTSKTRSSWTTPATTPPSPARARSTSSIRTPSH